VQGQPLLGDGVAQLADQLQPLARVQVPLARVELRARATALGLVHRHVGALEQRLRERGARADPERGVGQVRSQRQKQHRRGGRGGAPPARADLRRDRQQASEGGEETVHQPGRSARPRPR